MTNYDLAVAALEAGPTRVKRFKLSQRNPIEILEEVYARWTGLGYDVEIDLVPAVMYPRKSEVVYRGGAINPHARADGGNYGRD